MVIETKPGAGGTVGFADVAKADPDGYTVVISSTSMGTEMVLHRHLPYDPAKDFESVAMFGVQPNVLVASTAERLQDGRRSGRCGEGQARHADLCLRGRRLVVAYGRRTPPSRRRYRRAPRAVPRSGPHRSDGRPDRLLFHSARGGGLGARQRQAQRAGGEFAKAGRRCCRTCLRSPKPAIRRPSSASGSACRCRRRRRAPSSTNCTTRSRRRLADPGVAAKLAKLGVTPELMSVDDFQQICERRSQSHDRARQGSQYPAGGLEIAWHQSRHARRKAGHDD